jgi:hypothetical protein
MAVGLGVKRNSLLLNTLKRVITCQQLRSGSRLAGTGQCRIRSEGWVMTKLFLGLASLPFIASMAVAGQPVALSDTQMDKVTAGGFTYTTQTIPVGGISTNTYVIKTGNTTITYTELLPSFAINLIGPGF